MDRVDFLKQWMEREGRKLRWVAKQVGFSETWMSYVINRRRPMSDNLAQALEEKLPISFPKAKRPGQRRAAKG